MPNPEFERRSQSARNATQRPRPDDDLLWRDLKEWTRSAPATEGGGQASEIALEGIDRRGFLKLMAASLSLAGAAGCSRVPDKTIVPYVRAPVQAVAGDPLYFATAASHGGFAHGLLVKSTQGRPIKVEGNPAHPASMGGTSVFAQASVLELWDPDRAQNITHRGQVSTWDAFVATLSADISRRASSAGAGLRILTEGISSPTLADQLASLKDRFPAARWHQYEPVNRDNVYEGARMAFGEAVETRHRFDRARVVLSLDGDFLGGSCVRYARDFVSARRDASDRPSPGRMYMFECTPTLTGAYADHRWGVRFAEIEAVAREVARSVGLPVAGAPGPTAWPADAISACVRDLKENGGRSLVVAGDAQPPIVHALAHAINWTLGNVGHTVIYTAPVIADPGPQTESLRALVADMAAQRVQTLILLGGNPAYNAPPDIHFAAHLENVGLTVRLGLYDDETSALCHWHVPQAHFLESWSDTRAFDGTVSIQQPLIAPLYDGKSAHQLLAAVLGQSGASDYQAVRDFWGRARGRPDFDAFWTESLRRGYVDGTELPARPVTLDARLFEHAGAFVAAQGDAEIDLVFAPDPAVWDGRFANNGWLQEFPRPLTKLTWDNPAWIGPALADRLGLNNEDLVELRFRGTVVRAAVWIVPGQPDHTVTVTLGYGRERAGRVGNGVGFNAYRMRHSDAPWCGRGLEIRKTGDTYPLACTQHHFTMEGRRPVRSATLAQFNRDPAVVREDEPAHRPSLYEPVRYDGYAWGMSINLDACIGCGACTIACQAENNIPIVGKREVRRGREMHWIRVDRYYQGGPDRPRTYFQPVPCMHCERAPCEAVCPVEATVHDSEGLNLQVYNRCVGTRFCSNNCPYKVRRFNFLQYTDESVESLKAQRNPDVTVRTRGVMEKCTYCVQRITSARIEAEKSDRRLRDGEVVTACQAACPTEAILFGDLNDPHSRVNQAKASALNYALLAELGTRPRTTYLAKLTNPDPDLEKS